MMYCPEGMSWQELYEISLSNKYYLAAAQQYSCLEDHSFMIFDNPEEMLDNFRDQVDGLENDDGHIAAVLGYECEGESEVRWWDDNHNKQIHSMSFYIPKIEWMDERDEPAAQKKGASQ